MVAILIVASVLAYFAGENIDAAIIFGIVILNAVIGFIQEFKAEKAIEALKKLLAPHARVLRDGVEISIEAQNLVPGDIIILNEGDKISADAELLEENEIRIDESVLTGESMPVKKDIGKNKMIFMGTQVAYGTAKAVVINTGMRTEFGKIATLTTETQKDKSPLQKELGYIGIFVGKVTIAIATVLFLIGIFVQGREIVDTLLFAVAVAVAAVPEGLPATITVALALGVQRLAKKNAIVKQLSSVETLGSTTVICSDKTGTLTKNEMTVTEMMLDGHNINIKGIGYEPIGSFSIQEHAAEDKEKYIQFEKKDIAEIAKSHPQFYKHFELTLRAAALCNNARLQMTNDRLQETGNGLQAGDEWHILGDPTEGALITLAEKAGFSLETMHKKYKRLQEMPFDSTRKRMSVATEEIATKTVSIYVKGAPDSLLKLCTHVMQNGEIIPLDEKKREAILERTEFMAARALRTIGLAVKQTIEGKQLTTKFNKEEAERDLVFLGLIGMMDPPREEVKEAVKITRAAGIRTFIITGDFGTTALAIARELGIAKSDNVNIVTGERLDEISDSELLSLVKPGEETIFARVSPEHKLRIVEALKRSGEIVAVTGDGVNDAPALKRADIGVAMGQSGTDVSREAANMVLADDSFGTIVTAVIEGRTIYENMKKFIYYIFAANIGELLAVFITILIGLPAPLTAVLILIINTLTDVFPSLALGIEPVERDILEKPPRNPDAKIMEKSFIRRYVVVGFLIGSVTAGTFLWNLLDSGWRFGQEVDLDSFVYMQSATMAFVVLALLQMVHAFICRSETASFFRMNHLKNLYLVAAVASSVIITVALVQIPFFQNFLKTTPLTMQQWTILVGLSFSILVFEEIRKFFTRRRRAKLAAKYGILS